LLQFNERVYKSFFNLSSWLTITVPKLTIAQQNQLMELAAIGALPFDALVVLGFTPAEADELSQDTEVIDVHRRGRSEGAIKVRRALIKAGEAGSMTALKTLNLHKSEDELQAEIYPRRRVNQQQPVHVDVLTSVNELFARQRALMEAQDASDE
jgi:hypothetical protein